MEIMASLPSVVLGFFGALYLAPRMEDKIPALLCMAVLIPGLAALIAWFWTTRPQPGATNSAAVWNTSS